MNATRSCTRDIYASPKNIYMYNYVSACCSWRISKDLPERRALLTKTQMHLLMPVVTLRTRQLPSWIFQVWLKKKNWTTMMASVRRRNIDQPSNVCPSISKAINIIKGPRAYWEPINDSSFHALCRTCCPMIFYLGQAPCSSHL